LSDCFGGSTASASPSVMVLSTSFIDLPYPFTCAHR
jgi:hypothetical protein